MAKNKIVSGTGRAVGSSRAHAEGTFVVDKSYIRAEAREGLRTFFAPFTGVYRAAISGRFVTTGEGRRAPATTAREKYSD